MYSSLVLKNKSHKHPFHIVDSSPWPFYVSFALLFVTAGAAGFFNGYGAGLLRLGLFSLFFYITRWFVDIINEGTLGKHSKHVQEGFFFGFKLFVFSEAMIFFGVIWAFLHPLIIPTLAGGYVTPFYGFGGAPEDGLASVNSLLLFWSSITMYFADKSRRLNSRLGMSENLIYTAGLALVFCGVQSIEFHHLPFSFNDGAIANSFFFLIGLHASHVLIGGCCILFCGFLATKYYTFGNHVTFDCIQYYWHFVDWVWLFVVSFAYSDLLMESNDSLEANDASFAFFF